MRRHLIVGHFGPDHRPEVATEANEVVTPVNLLATNRQLDHGIGRALTDLARLSIFPAEIGVDLLVQAALVHAADTRISRKSEAQDNWTREIRLAVPVSDPNRWTNATPLVKRMLAFLTGDLWDLQFTHRPAEYASIVPRHADGQAQSAYDSVVLFSGGLDSLIGVIDILESGGKPLLVSHAGDGASSNAQYACFEALKNHYHRSTFNRLRVSTAFPKGLVRGVEAETTTRGRSFLFFAIGVFAGSGLAGHFSLRAPENGFIALNVPLDPLRLGALSTRTMHPFYLARWNELLQALGIDGQIENPYWRSTKAEMVSNCANPGLMRDLIPVSLSCSSPTKGRWQKRGIEHCGYCVPCIVRRAALQHVLGRGSDPTTYTVDDLAAHSLDTRQAKGAHVRSFQYAIRRIQTHPNLARLVIHKPGPLPDTSVASLQALEGVYVRGLEEVNELLKDVRTRPE